MAGVISRGIRGPIIREGDDIVDIVVNSVYASEQADGYTLQDRDVIAVTESVVARAQGQLMSLWIRLPRSTPAINSPRRNRWGWAASPYSSAGTGLASDVPEGHAPGPMDEVVILFSYPNDEVGNPLMVRSAYLQEPVQRGL